MNNDKSSPSVGGAAVDPTAIGNPEHFPPRTHTQVADPVDHPPHYTRSGIETIDVIEAWGLGFCLGNAVKYISRAGHKGSRLEDLRKAAWYLEREIERERINEGLAELAANAPLTGEAP